MVLILKTNAAAAIFIDFQDRLMPAMHGSGELESKVRAFASGCRILEVPVIVTQQYTKGLGDSIPALKEALGPFEHIEKTSFSCCRTPAFLEKLDSLNVKDVIIAGIEAHVCVQQTVLDLLERGFSVYVAADCESSRNERDMIYAESRMRQAGAVITTVESVLFEFLGDAGHPKRKEISALIK